MNYDAKFKNNSWEIYKDNNLLFKASKEQIWGKKKYDKDFFESERYKKLLLKRIEDDGIDKVYYLLTGKNNLNFYENNLNFYSTIFYTDNRLFRVLED